MNENELIAPPFPSPMSSYKNYVDSIKKYGDFITDGTNIFKNITENRITSKEEAIELAKNEILEDFADYNKISVYFDSESEIWLILFYVEDILGSGQSVFIDSNGLTRLIICESGPIYFIE